MRVTDTGFVYDVSNSSSPKQVCTFTSLLRLSSGKLLCTFRRGTTKSSADGNCCVAASEDQGKTWQVICDSFEAIHGGIRGEVRAAELAERDDGTLFTALTWLDRSKGKGMYSAQADTIVPSRIIWAESQDGGHTWENYRQIATREYHCPVLAGAIVRIPARGWLVTFEKQEPEHENGPSLHSAHALFTPDGRRFEQVVDVARHPQDSVYYYDQRQAVDAATGELVAAFWTYDRTAEADLDIHLSWGNPRTLTWQRPYPIGIEGQIAAPLPHPDGRLYLFYVHRNPPPSMRLVVSEDRGKTWQLNDEIVVYQKQQERGAGPGTSYASLWDDMALWSFGHPAGCFLDEHTLLLVYYAGPDQDNLSMHTARVELDG